MTDFEEIHPGCAVLYFTPSQLWPVRLDRPANGDTQIQRDTPRALVSGPRPDSVSAEDWDVLTAHVVDRRSYTVLAAERGVTGERIRQRARRAAKRLTCPLGVGGSESPGRFR